MTKFRSHITCHLLPAWECFFRSICSTCSHTDSFILIKTIDLSTRPGALVPANLISYVLWKAFWALTHGDGPSGEMKVPHVEEWAPYWGHFDHHKEETSREGRFAWGCGMQEMKRGKKCWCCILDLHGLSNIIKDLCKTLIPFCGELGVSGALSLFSLPRIKCSSNTCRSWVSFPCCRGQQQSKAVHRHHI